MLPTLLFVVLPLAQAGLSKPSSTSIESAAKFAGSAVTDLWPPVGATFTTSDVFFPDASQVGFGGPTPTGGEAEVIETASVAPVRSDIYPLIKPETSDKKTAFDVTQSWGNLSPFYSVPADTFGLPDTSSLVPSGCELTQVHLLHRHGARYPTSSDPPASFANLLQSKANSTGFTASGPLEFLNTWQYKFGQEILTPFGRQQLFNLGVSTRIKYGELLTGFTELPVFRTTSEDRMVDSALHFAAGFFDVRNYMHDYNQLIVIESSGFNNTLAPWNNCPNANNDIFNFGFNASDTWQGIYLKDTVKRLQQYIHGVNLTVADAAAMQQLCAYETVSLGYSKFCDLFTEEEWKGFEYWVDLEFWYVYGPGNPATAAQGIGYVQQLVSRLSKTPITTFDSSTNSTLDGNNVTFPLNQPIYVDATHDTVISAIVVALNFTSMAGNGPLPDDHIPEKKTYSVNTISPFASNLYGQVLSCPASSRSKSAEKEMFIRWVLNDAVVPLTGINHCSENKDGLCPLSDFLEGMQERIAEVDWNFDCGANYSFPVPDLITDGRMKK